MEEIAIPRCCSIGARAIHISSSSASPPLVGKMRSFFRWENGTSWRLQVSVLDRARISSLLIRSSTNVGENVLKNFIVFLPMRPKYVGIFTIVILLFLCFVKDVLWMG